MGALSALCRRAASYLRSAPAQAHRRADRRFRGGPGARPARRPQDPQDALALRDQRDQDVIDAEEFGLRVTEINERTDKLLQTRATHEPNRRLLADLVTEREHMFTFLTEPGVRATNWRAEQALRPAIVNRKSWGGNRTPKGARTQQITMSVIRTARQQDIDPLELMASAQRSRQPAASELITLPARASPTTLAPEAMPEQTPRPLPELSYRVVCYEIEDGKQTVILDATAQGFIAVTGTIDPDNTMRGEGTRAGPLALHKRILALIASDEQLAD